MAALLWAGALDRATEKLVQLTPSDRISIALHKFAAVEASDIIAFDYADGPNGVRGHRGATAFPSMLALAATFDRRLAAEFGVALARAGRTL